MPLWHSKASAASNQEQFKHIACPILISKSNSNTLRATFHILISEA